MPARLARAERAALVGLVSAARVAGGRLRRLDAERSLDELAGLAAGVTGGTDRVGVRVPAHEVARGLCRTCASALVATSANPSGQAASFDPEEVAASLGSAIDMLLDGGRTPGGPPSTIVDATGAEPRLVRAGAVRWEDIQTCLRA